MSDPNVAHEPATVARPTDADLGRYMTTIEAFLRTDYARQRIRTAVQREALVQLVMTPLESMDIHEACHRVAAILDLMANEGARLKRRRQAAEREVAEDAFGEACNASVAACREARS